MEKFSYTGEGIMENPYIGALDIIYINETHNWQNRK